MKEWELADENMLYLTEHTIPFAITSQGIKKPEDFYVNIRRSVAKGMDHRKIVQALSLQPAKWLKVEDQLGSLRNGAQASFLIFSDTIFKKEAILLSNWVNGKEYRIKEESKIELPGTYSINVAKENLYELIVREDKKGYKSWLKVKNQKDSVPATLSLDGFRINLAFTLEEELYRLSGSVSDSMSRLWSGKAFMDGDWVDWGAIKKSGEVKTDPEKDSLIHQRAPGPFYPNMAYGWDSLPLQAETILFRHATVWTNEAEGVLKNHDVLIRNGKIEMVGYRINMEVMFPELAGKVKEIDATGKHLTSGIVDEHSHIAISRGVNEAGQAITSEVSIGDVVDAEDINIYRQLAGGVTAAQLLHGSANPIGGQSALVKLRWGKTPAEMKIRGADGFIKFALGENVKQSNWGDEHTVRFPQTRMGVEQVFYDAFHRAKNYRAEQEIYAAGKKKEKKKTASPRRDLELEALAEILDSQRFITCHSYIQSEINMLMHVADSMNFRINTFTHILEGYKVADMLREHGAAASTFSDWWAYKFEVNDAIPYNAALLHERGVLTGFNSDDAEMGRRLNQEAAKAVKYGGVSEEEAWKFITLNPAKMLHLDHRMGSIKAGKDADLVLWSAHPLSVYTHAEQTYIDGSLYFDRERDKMLGKRDAEERERIVKKMMQSADKKKAQKYQPEEKKLYHCETMEQE